MDTNIAKETTYVTNTTEFYTEADVTELTLTDKSITKPKGEDLSGPALFLVGLLLLCIVKVGLDIRYAVRSSKDKRS